MIMSMSLPSLALNDNPKSLATPYWYPSLFLIASDWFPNEMSLHILQCPCNVLPLFVPCSTVTDGELDVSQQKTTYAKVFVLVFLIVDAEVFPGYFEVKKTTK